ncbi:MAG: hypothetical protein JRF72_21705, partial [Deltaproteobacteria bacterium]|nr:hypothetical protein [Deltaproteobacteria bacterium]
MCYLVYISTDFEGDLSQHNSGLISFEKDISEGDPDILDLLLHKNPWYVGSKAGCSCTLRHLHSIELGFGEPVEWYAEDPDEIEATRLFYDVMIDMISSGNQVDCIEFWSGTKQDQIKRLEVNLASISRQAF